MHRTIRLMMSGMLLLAPLIVSGTASAQFREAPPAPYPPAEARTRIRTLLDHVDAGNRQQTVATLTGLVVWYRDLIDEELSGAWQRDGRANLPEVVVSLADPQVASAIVAFSWNEGRQAAFIVGYAPMLGKLMARYPESARPFLDDLLGRGQPVPVLSPSEAEAVCRILLDMPDNGTWRKSALQILPHYRQSAESLLNQDLNGADGEKSTAARFWLADLGAATGAGGVQRVTTAQPVRSNSVPTANPAPDRGNSSPPTLARSDGPPPMPAQDTPRPVARTAAPPANPAPAVARPAASTAVSADAVKGVIDMVNAGLSEGLIIKQLRQRGKPIDLSLADMVKLQKAHVSEKIIATMLDPNSTADTEQAPAQPTSPQPPQPVDSQAGTRASPETAVPDARPQLSPAPAPPVAAREVMLPAGTEIAVRTIDAIDSKPADRNKEYTASLEGALTVDGVEAVPPLVTVFLRIDEIKQAGKLKGSASVSLRVVAMMVNGHRVRLETGDVVSSGPPKGKNTALRGVGGAAGGAAVGGLAAGPVGAGIGAAVGGTVGVTSALFNKGSVKVASESRLTFKLTQPAVIE
jgi:hypothetical protein